MIFELISWMEPGSFGTGKGALGFEFLELVIVNVHLDRQSTGWSVFISRAVRPLADWNQKQGQPVQSGLKS